MKKQNHFNSKALFAYTLDAAEVLGLEDKINSLQPGKLADLVMLE